MNKAVLIVAGIALVLVGLIAGMTTYDPPGRTSTINPGVCGSMFNPEAKSESEWLLGGDPLYTTAEECEPSTTRTILTWGGIGGGIVFVVLGLAVPSRKESTTTATK